MKNYKKLTAIFYLALSIMHIIDKVVNAIIKAWNKLDAWTYFKCFIPWIKARVDSGDGVLFTNVRYFNGDEITHRDFENTFNRRKEPMILESDQGTIFLIHGLPNGKIFTPETGERGIFEDSILQMLPHGEFWLVSCYNGTRSDIEGINVGGHIFHPVVCTEYMVHAGYNALTKEMYVSSCTKEFHKIMKAPIAEINK